MVTNSIKTMYYASCTLIWVYATSSFVETVYVYIKRGGACITAWNNNYRFIYMYIKFQADHKMKPKPKIMQHYAASLAIWWEAVDWIPRHIFWGKAEQLSDDNHADDEHVYT